MFSRDGISGLVCLAISIWLLALTFGLPPAAMVPIGPAFYPRIVLSLLAVLSIMLIVLDIRATRLMRAGGAAVSAAAAAGAASNYRLVLATFIEFGLYITLLPALGFRISTFVFMLAMQATLQWPRGIKRWALAIIVALATTLICYLIFEDYLSVLLPRGKWSGM
jgi:putative tricarboxylic transport membrane protein